jgi:hypothetical protein
MPKTPHLNSLKDDLEDRFLAFQVAELEKELINLGKHPQYMFLVIPKSRK